MKALVYTGPETLEYVDVADPAAPEGYELVRVEAVGICGSDMHAYLGHDERRPAPLILGHEAAGIVESGAMAGKRVTVNPLVSCGSCVACKVGKANLCPDRKILSMPPREGAFAQWVTTPADNLVEVPNGVPLDKAALAEPLACGWHAVRLGLEAADTVETALVIGGGAIGLGAALCARAQGAKDIKVIEPHMGRRRAVLGEGFEALSPDDLRDDAMFDMVVDGVGYAATRATSTKHARPGGVISHIGLGEATGGLDIRRMTLQEITFIGTYSYTPQDFRDTAAAIFDGSLGTLEWTEPRALADGALAFEDIRAARVDAPKIILYPEGAPT